MHDTSYNTMKSFLDNFNTNKKLKILDVGSLQFENHRTYKELCSSKWEYTGLDLKKGNNVDVVPEFPYKYPFNNNTFDIIISGQCMEHVSEPWTWVKELYRVLKSPGNICIIAPSDGKIHTEYDCWRILPQGMEYILKWAGFKNVKTDHKPGKWSDCIGIGEK